MDDIAVLDDVFLSFQTKQPAFTRVCKRPARDELFISDDFSANKSPFEVRMNDTCSLWRFSPCFNRPGVHFLFTRGEVCDETQLSIGSTDQTVKPCLFER